MDRTTVISQYPPICDELGPQKWLRPESNGIYSGDRCHPPRIYELYGSRRRRALHSARWRAYLAWRQTASRMVCRIHQSKHLCDKSNVGVLSSASARKKIASLICIEALTTCCCLKISISGDTKAADPDSHFRFHIEKDLWYAPGVGLFKSIQKEGRIGSEADAAGNSTNGTFSIVMLLENFRSEKPAGSSGREK